MIFMTTYAMRQWRDFPLAGPALAAWFCLTGFFMTYAWYSGARRLRRKPAPRFLLKRTGFKLWVVAVLVGLRWMSGLYFVPGPSDDLTSHFPPAPAQSKLRRATP